MSMIPNDKRSSLFAGMWKARSKKGFTRMTTTAGVDVTKNDTKL
jgi:hypothetical protein